MSFAARAAGRTRRTGYRGTLYILRNGKLAPEPAQIRRRLPDISGRAISTMIKFAAFNDLYRIYAATAAADLDFRYIAIPDDFESQSEEAFDPREMTRLFELGYAMGLAGTAWQDKPSGSQQSQRDP